MKRLWLKTSFPLFAVSIFLECPLTFPFEQDGRSESKSKSRRPFFEGVMKRLTELFIIEQMMVKLHWENVC